MSGTEFTAKDAAALANADADTREETLSYFESIIRSTAEGQRVRTVTVALPKERFTKASIEFAILTLTTRGFDVEKVEGVDNPTYKVSF
ncbi:hypothetical protein [Xanthomonas campestris]|uniref:hypothetical protein n=1 Tax=Xanthomonas cannabis TaxID=1885674 RepID=UPI001E2C00AA|nr:hypothetical protein [Xanthomonas campestris pv. zinniae]